MRLFSAASTELQPLTVGQTGGDRMSGENATVVMTADKDAAVKFVPATDAGNVDVAANQNGPTDDSPSTSADAVVTAEKSHKKQKTKKEKPNVVGIFDLVNFFCYFLQNCEW